MKVIQTVGISGSYFNIINEVYSTPSANINLNRKKLKAIPVKPETRQSCSLSLYIFNRVLGILDRVMRQLKEIKKIKIC